MEHPRCEDPPHVRLDVRLLVTRREGGRRAALLQEPQISEDPEVPGHREVAARPVDHAPLQPRGSFPFRVHSEGVHLPPAQRWLARAQLLANIS